MEQNTPSWLDAKFITTVIEKLECSKLKINILSQCVTSAVAPGNNFLSYMYRVQVRYELETDDGHKFLSFIVKVPLDKGVMEEAQDKHDFFGIEPKVYKELLPLMFLKCGVQIGPKPLYSLIKNVIVAQDLKEDSYIMCDKAKQLDFSHCLKVITHLAKFHAASISCYHDKPSFIKDELSVELFWTEGGYVENMGKTGVKMMMKSLQEVEGCERLAAAINNRSDQEIWNSAVKLLKTRPLGLNVLNHGDLWTNNIMFKYDNIGQIQDVKFIDFQIPKFTSPIQDLLYFTWTSANEEVRRHKLSELYSIYAQTLNSTLDSLNCNERVTEEDLLKELKSGMDWALLVISQPLAVMMADSEEPFDFGALEKEDYETENLIKLYSGKLYKSVLQSILVDFTNFFLDVKN